MTLPHAQLEALARQICEGRRGEGAYDRKGCKRAHWRELAMRAEAKSFTSFVQTLKGWGWIA
jgi:hypothetical protein